MDLLCDLHVHSCFSADSQAPLEAMCHQAVEKGLCEVAFTEHVDLVPADPGCGYFRPAAFLDEVARCREVFADRLTILAGVEVGEPHRFRPQIDELLAHYHFDLVMGSLHWVGDDPVFLPERYFEHRSVERGYRDYFSELEGMCRAGGFDVLGHLDLVKRYSPDPTYDPADYEELIRPVLEVLIRNGIALEVNTSTLFRPVRQPSPNGDVVRWYREMGGEWVTFGSDAHSPERLAAGWGQAMSLVRGAGFTRLTTFRRRSRLTIQAGAEP